MRHRKATAILAASLFFAFFGSRQAFAQDEASQVDPAFVQLQNALKVDDTLTITSDNGSKVKGRLIEITGDHLLLRGRTDSRYRRPANREGRKEKERCAAWRDNWRGCKRSFRFGFSPMRITRGAVRPPLFYSRHDGTWDRCRH